VSNVVTLLCLLFILFFTSVKKIINVGLLWQPDVRSLTLRAGVAQRADVFYSFYFIMTSYTKYSIKIVGWRVYFQ